MSDGDELVELSRRDQIPLHAFLDLRYAPRVEGSGTSEVRMRIQPDVLGFTGNLHGGAIATMVDVSCALAAATSEGFDPYRQSLVTADMHVRYLGRPHSEEVVARGTVVKAGSRLIVIECRVTDDEGHLVAVADFSMMIVELRDPLPGMPGPPPADPDDPDGPEAAALGSTQN